MLVGYESYLTRHVPSCDIKIEEISLINFRTALTT